MSSKVQASSMEQSLSPLAQGGAGLPVLAHLADVQPCVRLSSFQQAVVPQPFAEEWVDHRSDLLSLLTQAAGILDESYCENGTPAQQVINTSGIYNEFATPQASILANDVEEGFDLFEFLQNDTAAVAAGQSLLAPMTPEDVDLILSSPECSPQHGLALSPPPAWLLANADDDGYFSGSSPAPSLVTDVSPPARQQQDDAQFTSLDGLDLLAVLEERTQSSGCLPLLPVNSSPLFIQAQPPSYDAVNTLRMIHSPLELNTSQASVGQFTPLAGGSLAVSPSDSSELSSPTSSVASQLASPVLAAGPSSGLSSPCGEAQTEEAGAAAALRPKPYERPSKAAARGIPAEAVLAERKARKMQQNKDAAARYREKRRQEAAERDGEAEALEARNQELRAQVQGVRSELAYLRQLLAEVHAARHSSAAPAT